MSELKIDQTREYVVAKGKEHWCETFFAEEDELLIDLDLLHISSDLNDTVDTFMKIIESENGPGTCPYADYPRLMTTSRNGNRHLYIKLSRSYPELVRIALQAVLGSDPTRELLSALQSEVSMPAAVALFETANEAEKVKLWREGYKNGKENGQ
jgi:hypothetical protein